MVPQYPGPVQYCTEYRVHQWRSLWWLSLIWNHIDIPTYLLIIYTPYIYTGCSTYWRRRVYAVLVYLYFGIPAFLGNINRGPPIGRLPVIRFHPDLFSSFGRLLKSSPLQIFSLLFFLFLPFHTPQLYFTDSFPFLQFIVITFLFRAGSLSSACFVNFDFPQSCISLVCALEKKKKKGRNNKGRIKSIKLRSYLLQSYSLYQFFDIWG